MPHETRDPIRPATLVCLALLLWWPSLTVSGQAPEPVPFPDDQTAPRPDVLETRLYGPEELGATTALPAGTFPAASLPESLAEVQACSPDPVRVIIPLPRDGTSATDARMWPPRHDGAVLADTGASAPAELAFTSREAVLAALRSNHSLQVQRLGVEISQTRIDGEKARFDPSVAAEISNSDRLGKQILQTGALGDNVGNRTDASLGWSRRSPNGTEAGLSVTTTRNRSARAPNLFSTRLGLDLTHPLRQGAGPEVNLVSVRQAELEWQASRHQLAGFVMALAADVEKKYWNLFLAAQQLVIQRESLVLAQVQREETQKRIALGQIPESELAAAEAEVALREEAVIDAESSREAARIALLRLINHESERFWEFDVVLTEVPIIGEEGLLTPGQHAEIARTRRPEILEAATRLEKGELELVRTRNGLLPRLDFFVDLGKTGYAQTLEGTATEFGQKGYDLQAGLQYEIALGRREARQADQRARLTLAQQQEALRNLTQLVQEDVLTAYLEVQRARQQVQATAKTIAKQEEKLRVEEIKFNLGKSTAFQVAQAQRDVAASRISALMARIGYRNALTDLWRFEGTLGEHLGLTIDARAPSPPLPR